MPIKISNALLQKLPENERDSDVKQILWEKSGDLCFLCEGTLIREAGEIEADHDHPEDDGGPTTIQNLNLVHAFCNRFKRNHPTAKVRPFLRLQKLLQAEGGQVQYDKALTLLDFAPKPVGFKDKGECLEIRRNGETEFQSFPVFTEVASGEEREFRFAFVELGPTDFFNDKKVQPRNIREKHVWSIYNDLVMNPLHEPPGCRVDNKSRSKADLLLFDGQHKAIASWIGGKPTLAVKVYLDLEQEEAVRLVNSIQSKIKKLPLSPFEVAAKMAQEWQDRFEKYSVEVGEDGTEKHFFEWVESDHRTRARQAFQDALIQFVLDDENLEMKGMVQVQGGANVQEGPTLKENTFKTKVLKPLIQLNPLEYSSVEGQVKRVMEKRNIVTVLNLLFEKAFAPAMTEEATEIEKRIGKQMSYQSALMYIARLLKGIVNQRLVASSPEEAFYHKDIQDKTLNKISGDIERLCAHPIWKAPATSTQPKVVAVREALSKNQTAKLVFEAVKLTVGYCVGADEFENVLD